MSKQNKMKCMEYENLSKEAQEAARRIASRTGETPQQVAIRTARAFADNGTACRVRRII